MKKLFLFTLLAFSSQFLTAQQRFDTYVVKPCYASGDAFSAFKALCLSDTLDAHRKRSTGFNIRGVTNGGYVYGVSNDGTSASVTDATGYYFDSVGQANIVEVFVWVGAKRIVGGGDLLRCELYNTGPDSLPTQLLGYGETNLGFVDTSSTVNFGSGNGLARFYIDIGSNAVNADFVVAMNYAGFNDTLGIVSNDNGDGLNEFRAKQMLGVGLGSGWVRANDIWTTGSNDDPMIIPIFECNSTGVAPAKMGGKYLSLEPVFPNPATSTALLKYNLSQSLKTRITLWDVQGRTSFDSGVHRLAAGDHEVSFDVSDLPSGNYYYSIITEKERLSGKIEVKH